MESERRTVNFGNFIQSSTVDYRKYVSSVFFLRGCNLDCYCCQNAEICKLQDIRYVDELIEMIDDSCTFSSAIVFSGGECTLQGEALKEMCEYARDKGFKVAIQTNGTRPNTIKELLDSGNLDKVAMDVKTTWDNYSNYCGIHTDYTEDIKKSILICKEARANGVIEDFEIVTTVFKNNVDDVLPISYYFDGVDHILNNGVIDNSESFSFDEMVDMCEMLNKNNRIWIRSKDCGDVEYKDGKLYLSNGMEYIK